MGKNCRMINLTWKFSFWVFERCSLLIWLSILLVLYIYFNWGQSFCGQNLSKKQEWSLRLKRFQAKYWNLEAVTYFYSILCVFLCPFYLLCVCVCVFTSILSSVCVYVHSPWRLHLSGTVGMSESRSRMLRWRRFFCLPSPFIATLEWSTKTFH